MNNKLKNPFSVWLILDIVVNIFTMIAVVTILANSIKGFMMAFITLLFVLWTFRPLYLAFEELKNQKVEKVKKPLKLNLRWFNLFYYSIFLLITIIGALLFINRYVFIFMPSGNWKILLDHFVAGFLVPLWFFIVYLGIGSFFHPNRKIIYSIKWFFIFTCLALLVPILWDGIIQHWRDIDQIASEIIGIALSWIYFLYFRNVKLRNEDKPIKETS